MTSISILATPLAAGVVPECNCRSLSPWATWPLDYCLFDRSSFVIFVVVGPHVPGCVFQFFKHILSISSTLVMYFLPFIVIIVWSDDLHYDFMCYSVDLFYVILLTCLMC